MKEFHWKTSLVGSAPMSFRARLGGIRFPMDTSQNLFHSFQKKWTDDSQNSILHQTIVVVVSPTRNKVSTCIQVDVDVPETVSGIGCLFLDVVAVVNVGVGQLCGPIMTTVHHVQRCQGTFESRAQLSHGFVGFRSFISGDCHSVQSPPALNDAGHNLVVVVVVAVTLLSV